MIKKYMLIPSTPNTFQLRLIPFILLICNSFPATATNHRKTKPHVLSLATAITDQGTYQYGIASYETKGKGKESDWHFFPKSTHFVNVLFVMTRMDD